MRRSRRRDDGQAFCLPAAADTPDRALEDAAGALRYVRARANNYSIDPKRVGMMGFSAGALLTHTTVLKLPPTERPAFIAPIYPRMTARDVPVDPPPMFFAIATDDFLMNPSLGLITSWYRARRPVEFHLYQQADHGFGRPGTTTAGWFDAFLRWREQNRRLATAPTR